MAMVSLPRARTFLNRELTRHAIISKRYMSLFVLAHAPNKRSSTDVMLGKPISRRYDDNGGGGDGREQG